MIEVYDQQNGRGGLAMLRQQMPNAPQVVAGYHNARLTYENAIRRTGDQDDWDTDGGGVAPNTWTRLSFPDEQIVGDMYRGVDFTIHLQTEGRYLVHVYFTGQLPTGAADALQVDKVELDMVVHRQGALDTRIPLNIAWAQRHEDRPSGLIYQTWMYAWTLVGADLIEHRTGSSYSFQWRFSGFGTIDSVDAFGMRVSMVRISETPIYAAECCGEIE